MLSQNQPISHQYKLCTNCNHAGNNNGNIVHNYANPGNYVPGDVTSDFGPRVTYDYHGGIDYRPLNGGMGDAILAVGTGTIIDIERNNRYLKSLVIEYPNYCNCTMGYRHIFNNLDNPNYPNFASPPTGQINNLREGGFVLQSIGNSNYAIIVLPGVHGANGYALSNIPGQNVTYNGITYITSNQVTAGLPLAPLGRSGYQGSPGTGAPEYPPHLHIQGIDNLNAANIWDDAIAFNPLQVLLPIGPSYQTNFIAVAQGGNVNIANPPTGILKRYNSANTPILTRVRITPLNIGTANRYPQVYDVEKVELQIRPNVANNQNQFSTIRGTNRDAYIQVGGQRNTPIEPPHVEDQSGNFTRTGISPNCYADGNGYPWDNFYFTEFYHRISSADNYTNNQTILARNNTEARYPDGNYEVYAKVTNIKGQVMPPDQNNVAPFTIDNFTPYVSSVTVFERPLYGFGFDLLSYQKAGTHNGLNGTYNTGNGGPTREVDVNHNVLIKVKTSEPMTMLSLRAGQAAPGTQFHIAAPLFTNANRTEFHFEVPSSFLQNWATLGLGNVVPLTISGNDQANNSLLDLENMAGFPAAVVIPIRNTNNGWVNNPVFGQDQLHYFTISECSLGESLASTQATAVNNLSFTSGPNQCDGSISLTQGSTGPYTWAWSGPNGFTASTLNISNLCVGDYSLTITNANGCQRVINVPILDCSLQLDGTATDATLFSNNDGSITLNANAGENSLSQEVLFNWTGPAGYSSTDQNIDALAPGVYAVTATTDFGCTASRSFLVNGPCEDPCDQIEIPASVMPSCNNNGRIDVTLDLIEGELFYIWSNGQTGASISGLAPGTYCVTVLESSGCCTHTACFEVMSTFSVQAAIQGVCSSGQDNGGTIVAYCSPQDPFVYEYVWDNGAQQPFLQSIGAGDYCVTVTQTNTQTGAQCFSDACFNVPSYGSPTVSLYDSYAPCAGMSNGSINCTVSGGLAPYTYYWSDGTSNTGTRQNLGVGNYAVTVYDANGCATTNNVTLNGLPQLTISNSIVRPSCVNDQNVSIDNGSIEITVAGGVPPYDYSWSNSGNQFSQLATNLGAHDEYSVTITDFAGCTMEQTFYMPNTYPKLEFDLFADPACNLQGASLSYTYNTGAVHAQITSNTNSPYAYLWSNGSTANYLENLPSGYYQLTITDGNLCSFTEQVQVGLVAATPSFDCNVLTATCGGTVVGTHSYPYVEEWDAENCNLTLRCPLPPFNVYQEYFGSRESEVQFIANSCYEVSYCSNPLYPGERLFEESGPYGTFGLGNEICYNCPGCPNGYALFEQVCYYQNRDGDMVSEPTGATVCALRPIPPPAGNFIDVEKIEELVFYPNPTSGSLEAQLPNEFVADRVKIVDMTGQSIEIPFFQLDQKLALNVEFLPNGVYQVVIFTRTNDFKQNKIIIQK